MDPMAAPSLTSRALEFFKSLDITLKGVVIGAAIVLCTLFFVSRSSAAETRMDSLEQRVEAEQTQLQRIEEKLDRLILKLID